MTPEYTQWLNHKLMLEFILVPAMLPLLIIMLIIARDAGLELLGGPILLGIGLIVFGLWLPEWQDGYLGWEQVRNAVLSFSLSSIGWTIFFVIAARPIRKGGPSKSHSEILDPRAVYPTHVSDPDLRRRALVKRG